MDVAQMLKMSQAELDDLFRASPAGTIPKGEGDGTAIVAPGTELSEVAARVVNLLAWRGKVFDPASGTLRNRILPFGARAIVAKVSQDVSWFDGKQCTVLDYSRTSRVAHRVRDEMREVAPNIYLGIVFWGEEKTINFALDFTHLQTRVSLWRRLLQRLHLA